MKLIPVHLYNNVWGRGSCGMLPNNSFAITNSALESLDIELCKSQLILLEL